MSFRNSFGKTKRNATEAESTWQRQHKRFKRSNKFLFYTEHNLEETKYYNDKMRNTCECVIISSSVKSIAKGAFRGFGNLHSVIFDDTSSLEEIQSHTFLHCTNLQNIVLPPSLKTIGKFAFSNCKSLRSMIIPPSVHVIDSSAFQHCKSLTDILFDDTSLLEEIPSHAFFNCTKLTRIVLPPLVKTIGFFAFSYCETLTSMSIPSLVQVIEESAFTNCKSLKDINLPSSLQLIDVKAFYKCSMLEAITVPNTVDKISRSTFEGCWTLKNMIIPPSVRTIEDRAFQNCHSLQSLSLPPTLDIFGDHVIHNCKQLWTLHVPSIDFGILGWDRDISYSDFKNFDNRLIILCNSTRFPNEMEQWQPIMILHDIAHTCLNLHHISNRRVHATPEATDSHSFNAILTKKKKGAPDTPRDRSRYYFRRTSVHNYKDTRNYVRLSGEKRKNQDIKKELNKDQQIKKLGKVLEEFFPDAADAASSHQLNMLHILTQFPCTDNDVVVDCAGCTSLTKDIVLDAMKALLEEYPAAALSMDKYGRTPIHYLFELNPWRHQSVVQLLMSYCDDTILQKAIESKYPSYTVIEKIASVKPVLLSSTHEETGLFPFMTAAMEWNRSDLTTTYKLLQMKPDILLHYN